MVFSISGHLGFLADKFIDGDHAAVENRVGARYFNFPLGITHWGSANVVFTWRPGPLDGSRVADNPTFISISFHYPDAVIGKNAVVLDAFNLDNFLDAIIG